MIKRSEKTGLSLDRLRDLIPGKGSASSGPGRATGVPLRLRRLVQPGLQTRFVTTVALVMLCMITVLVAVTVQYQRSTLRHDLERRVEVLAELVASQPLIRQADPSGDGLQDVADFPAAKQASGHVLAAFRRKSRIVRSPKIIPKATSNPNTAPDAPNVIV